MKELIAIMVLIAFLIVNTSYIAYQFGWGQGQMDGWNNHIKYGVKKCPDGFFYFNISEIPEKMRIDSGEIIFNSSLCQEGEKSVEVTCDCAKPPEDWDGFSSYLACAMACYKCIPENATAWNYDIDKDEWIA